jgi:hypothetical protein
VPQGELNGPTRVLLLVNVLDDDGNVSTSQAIPVVLEGVVKSAEAISVPDAARLDEPVVFGDVLQLVGLEAGEQSVTLYWEALADVGTDYVAFVHVVDADGNIVVQSDTMPNDGLSPTTLWQPGALVRDSREFSLASPEQMALLIGVYNPANLVRLNAVQSDRQMDDGVFRFTVE